MTFKEGDQAYIIENNTKVTPVTIYEKQGDFYTLGLRDAVISLRSTRLYRTRREAERELPERIKVAEEAKNNQQMCCAGSKPYSPYDHSNYRSPYGI